MKYFLPNSEIIEPTASLSTLKIEADTNSSLFFSLNKSIYDLSDAKIKDAETFKFIEFLESSTREESVVISGTQESAQVPVESKIEILSPETISDAIMTRDVIVELRIKNGEGTSSDQFSNEFPYERKV